MYFTQETAQRWGPPAAEPVDGAALWLPGRLLLQLQMLPPVGINSLQALQNCNGCSAASWLAGRLLLQLRMVSRVCPPEQDIAAG